MQTLPHLTQAKLHPYICLVHIVQLHQSPDFTLPKTPSHHVKPTTPVMSQFPNQTNYQLMREKWKKNTVAMKPQLHHGGFVSERHRVLLFQDEFSTL